MLSVRATETYVKSEEFLMRYLSACDQDPYCQLLNQDGMVNLGTAVNVLCKDIIFEKLNQPGLFRYHAELQSYYGLTGTKELRETLAGFLTRYFSKGIEIQPTNLRVVNGVSSGLEALGWCLCDPGDVVIVPVPTYGRFYADLEERVQATVVNVNLTGENDFDLNLDVLKEEMEKWILKGKNVRALILCNPHNPLGQVFSRETVKSVLELCAEYNVHIIADEIYAMSVHGEEATFNSVLSFYEEEVPSSRHIHFLWGMSKDFGLAGLRTGFIHSFNKDVLKALDGMSFFTSVSSHIQQICVELLRDELWLDNVYFPANRTRLKEAFNLVKAAFDKLNIRMVPGCAGLFCWLDLSRFLEEQSTSSEMELFQRFFDEGKVYIVPGTEFACSEPGWFRIVFTVERTVLVEGLNRINKILEEIEKMNTLEITAL